MKYVINTQTRVTKLGFEILFCAVHLSQRIYHIRLSHSTNYIHSWTYAQYPCTQVQYLCPSELTVSQRPVTQNGTNNGQAYHQNSSYKLHRFSTGVNLRYEGIPCTLSQSEPTIDYFVNFRYILNNTELPQD